MPFRTPDQFPGVTHQEGLVLLDESVLPLLVGEFRLDGVNLFARDGVGVFNLRQGGGTLPVPTAPGQHLVTRDGVTAVWECPITSRRNGWLVNNRGQLIVEGIDP